MGSNKMDFIEPWRCENCNQLMYDLKDGYPCEGVPTGVIVTLPILDRRMKVCQLCAEMYLIVGNNKFLMEAYKQDIEEAKKKEKLKPGSNYLDKRD